MTKLYIDIETRSRIELKKTGVYRYAECPDFRVLMASWAIDDNPVQTELGEDAILRIPGLLDPDVEKVAHNAQFERVCFSRLFRGQYELEEGEYLDPEHWRDTQALVAEWGYPQSLDLAGKAIGGEVKDSAGTRLINLFCKPNRKGEWNGPETHPMEWLEFIAYCEQDVETLRSIDKHVTSLGGWPTEVERQVFLADQRINDLGIAIDTEMASLARAEAERNQTRQLARSVEITGLENPNSVQQFGGWLKAGGLTVPNLRSETVEKLLMGELTPEQREALELRQELALAASKKYGAALGAVLPDGRLRGTLKFFGAHTGRWAGRGTQIQNLPRLAFDNEADEQLCIQELRDGEEVSAEDLKRLVRPMFVGPFTVVDYAAIEARVISWLAGETWALEAFYAGRDIYVETANRMGGLTRSQGKIAVLALGYNGGAGSLKAMATEKDTFIKGKTDKQLLKEYVYPWRAANSEIVGLWADMERAFVKGGKIREHLSFETDGKDRYLRLPSGRVIGYHDIGAIRRDDRVRLYFKGTQGYRVDTYGGRLAENVTQAVARDVMAEALVRLQSRGYRVVGHVHDEILVEGKHDVEEISKIMTEVPDWAYGLPIDGEGFVCNRYKKG